MKSGCFLPTATLFFNLFCFEKQMLFHTAQAGSSDFPLIFFSGILKNSSLPVAFQIFNPYSTCI